MPFTEALAAAITLNDRLVTAPICRRSASMGNGVGLHCRGDCRSRWEIMHVFYTAHTLSVRFLPCQCEFELSKPESHVSETVMRSERATLYRSPCR
jgi:hypothetical protein